MTVVNEEYANETVFNAAFVSRTAAQSIAGGKAFSNYVAFTRADVATTATITAMASSTSFVKMTGSTATEIQGITAGTNGQLLKIYNGSTATVSFAHENAGATAANRLDLPENDYIYLYADTSAELIYDSALARWVLISTAPMFGEVTFQRNFQLVPATDTATGAAATLTVPSTPLVSLTNGSLTTVAGIAAGESGQVVYVINNTGVSIDILDENAGATAANRIRTGSAADVTIQNHGTIILVYNAVSSRWNMIGGSGGGGGSSRVSGVFTGTAITPTASVSDETFLYTGGSSQTFTGWGTISGLTNGYRCTVMGSSNTNLLTIEHNDASDGWLVNGNTALGLGQCQHFEYNSTLARMVEISRNF